MKKSSLFFSLLLLTATSCKPPVQQISNVESTTVSSGFSGTYSTLQTLLATPQFSDSAWREKLDSALSQHFIFEADENVDRAGGVKRQIVFLMTNQPRKLSEYQNMFDLYGLEVYPVPDNTNVDYLKTLAGLKKANFTVKGVLKEDSSLRDPADPTKIITKYVDGMAAANYSDLRVYSISKDGTLSHNDYTDVIQGRINMAKRQVGNPNVWDWDDIFEVLSTGQTYYEASLANKKISARTTTASKFIRDYMFYKDFTNLKFNPVSVNRVVDFSTSVSQYVAANKYYNPPADQRARFPIFNVLEATSVSGLFFRASINRRQKTYWLPGLNAGLPLVSKKDEIHELTYMDHDFTHFLIPDLIYTGNHSVMNREVYIVYRMLSEAVTLVMADMAFVDALGHMGVQYDFSTRKVYPLFQDLGIDLTNKDTFAANLRILLEANVDFCLRGSDAGYKKLLEKNGKSEANLDAFKKKYSEFFIQDYRWTERNYTSMQEKSPELKKWWSTVEPLRESLGIQVESIEEYAARVEKKPGDMIDKIFDEIYTNRILPVLQGNFPRLSEAQQLKVAFGRYMMGQLEIFARFDTDPDSLQARDAILAQLQNTDVYTQDFIASVRGNYESALQKMMNKQLITLDDYNTYCEVFPMFNPFFLSYDRESTVTLADTAHQILFSALETNAKNSCPRTFLGLIAP